MLDDPSFSATFLDMRDTPNEYLTTGEAADLLGVGRDTIVRWVESGHLRSLPRPPGKGWHRFLRSDVERLATPQDR